MKVLLFLPLFWLGNLALAQQNRVPITIGYFAPYGIQVGAKVGTAFKIKEWESERRNKTLQNQLRVGPQLGYFLFPTVQHNFLFNGELSYHRIKKDRKLNPKASLGLGYLLASQRQGGTVSLSTGDIEYEVERIHYFAPTLSLGFVSTPKNKIGYYLEGFYGRKITGALNNSALFGLELGVTLQLPDKD